MTIHFLLVSRFLLPVHVLHCLFYINIIIIKILILLIILIITIALSMDIFY